MQNPSLTHWDPATSSDGARLAFAVKDSSNFDVFLVNLRNQSKPSRKLFSSEDEWDPSFSADGRYLFYAGTSLTGSQIRAICIN
jgi:Tol biopolymer transport system component